MEGQSSEASPYRVLYVNDDSSFAKLVRTKFGGSDVDVRLETAATRAEALDRLDGADFECVVTAYSLGTGTGLDLAEAIRETRQDLPIVLFTGNGSEAVAGRATRVGITDYMPMRSGRNNFELLANRIETLVGAERERRRGRRSAERFQRILERTNDAVYAVDSEWRIEYMNDRMAARVDRDVEAVVGERLWDEFPSILDTELETLYREAMATGEPATTEQWLGEPFEYLVDVRVFPDADGLTVFSREVTGRRRRRQELQQAEAILENVDEFVLVLDADKEIQFANGPAMRALTGAEASDIVGESLFDVISEGNRKTVASQLLDSFEEALASAGSDDAIGEGDATNYRTRIEPSTNDRTLDVTLSPLETDGGTAVIVVARDVTGQAAAKNQLRRERDALRTVQSTIATEGLTHDERISKVLEASRAVLDVDVGFLATDDEVAFAAVEPPDGDAVYEAVVEEEANLVDADASRDTLVTFGGGDGGHAETSSTLTGVGSYVGCPVFVDDAFHGRLAFASADVPESEFTAYQETLVQLIAQWVGGELSRERNRERATANRDRLRQIIDMLPQLVFAKDESGEFLLANTAVAEAYGTTVSELEGMTDADFADSAAEAEAFREDDMAVIESGTRTHIDEEALTTADGEERRLRTTKIPYEPVESDERAILGVSSDITELKAYEAELEVQSAALEASMDGIAIVDNDEYVYMNDAHADIFGYETSELVGRDWRYLYEDDEVARIETDVFECLEEDGDWRGETVGKRSDGSPVQQEITLSNLDDGKLVCTNREITGRKRREREIRALKERLDLAVEGAGVGIWDWDVATDEVVFNDQWAEMLGHSLDEIEPHVDAWERRVHPEDLPAVEEQLEAHIAGETELYDTEHRMRTKDGDWMWVRDIGQVVERTDDGAPERAVGIHLDITRRKSSERALERERDIFAEGPAVVFQWRNADGWPVEYVSKNVTEAFGYSPEELYDGSKTYETFVHDDDLERVRADMSDVLDSDVDRIEHEPYRIVTKGGEVRWVTDNTKILRNEDGEITNFLGYLIDITERKNLEASLRENVASLRQLYEVTAETGASFEEKLEQVLELSCERLGLQYGFMTRIEDGTQEVVQAYGSHEQLQEGGTAPLSEAYCRKTVAGEGLTAVADSVEEGWADDPAYDRFGLGCYLGGKLEVDGTVVGTLCWANDASRPHSFSDAEETFVELVVQWVSYELEKRRAEEKLRRLQTVTDELMDETSIEGIGSTAVEAASDVLELDVTAIWSYDEQRDVLAPVTESEAATDVVSEVPVFERGEGLAWEVFEDGERRRYDDVSAVDGRHNERTPLKSEILVPLGDWGLMTTGSTVEGQFSESDADLFGILGSSVEGAMSRSERETQLRRQNDRLDEFASVVAHDLRNPLTVAMGMLEAAQDTGELHYLDEIESSHDRIQRLIDDLLTLARGDTTVADPSRVDLEVVATKAWRFVDTGPASFELDDSVPVVSADDSRAAQLFENLFRNAIEHNEESVEVTVGGDETGFFVEDDGTGIAPEERETVFEHGVTSNADGTGFGLSIVEDIATAHGWSVQVVDGRDGGARFEFRTERTNR